MEVHGLSVKEILRILVLLWIFTEVSKRVDGGQGGIRTLDRVTPMPVFETGTFNHSVTCPHHLQGSGFLGVAGINPCEGRLLARYDAKVEQNYKKQG